MLLKESKIRVLENFYALDYMFFGKPITEVNCGCPICIEEYVTLKGALLSTIVEMYKLIEHTPTEISNKLDTKSLNEMAKTTAILARDNAKNLVMTERCKEEIKYDVKEYVKENIDADINPAIALKLKEKAFSLGIDNLLIARALTESTNVGALNEWSGRFLEDAYKALRESIVDSAIDVINT